MVKIPSLSRRSEPAPTRDENLDGRIDGRDAPATSGRDGSTPVATGPDGSTPAGADRTAPTSPAPARTDRDADRSTHRGNAAPGGEAVTDTERRAAERGAVARAATARPADAGARRDPETTPERTVDRGSDVDRDRTARPDGTEQVATDADRVEPARPVVRGPRPRASLLATLGLVIGVAGALFVLTGTLAGYGIGLGAVGAVLSVLGLVATRRRHVAGKTDALFGIVFGLGAVVLGVLAMTGQFDWPTTDGDWVPRFREWLDSQFVDRF
ncbi:thrombospondin [Micromonospora sp. WMMD812]|uniref:thrombospondin n=1 Tax=Micromonospora sp. WMMD812 TaxID=3015152 RepID=UPI00248D0E9E|nr:thrombospondin [Micromonospora sp. WMMD812]WBB66664.1 thrombospondin [Micromonospora sp. WMMD812]